jgi:hypothetical protein
MDYPWSRAARVKVRLSIISILGSDLEVQSNWSPRPAITEEQWYRNVSPIMYKDRPGITVTDT